MSATAHAAHVNRNRPKAGPEHRERSTGRVAPIRPLARLAWRDMRSHPMRSAMSIALIALAVLVFVVGLAATTAEKPARETALASLPEGVQARIVATTVGGPLPQPPEGLKIWFDDPTLLPASEQELRQRLSPGVQLAPYWRAREMLITSGIRGEIGVTAAAGSGAELLSGPGLSAIRRTGVTEADATALPYLLPPLIEGAPPANATEIAIPSDLAQHLGVKVGETITLIAPPDTGVRDERGGAGAVIENQQRSYRLTGITEPTSNPSAQAGETEVYTLAGWIAPATQAAPEGVSRTWLALGDVPVPWAQVKALNQLGVMTVSRDALVNYPPEDELYPTEPDLFAEAQRAFGLAAASTLGIALMLCLVTPAFMVATQQQRRLLGLTSAVGARPADLRRLITVQGMLVGFLGGALGLTVGIPAVIALLRALKPGDDVVGGFPWLWMPLALLLSVALGYIATLSAARWAAKQQPVDALKARSLGANTSTGPLPVWRRVLGPVLLVVAVLASIATITVPMPSFSEVYQSPEDFGAGPPPMVSLLVTITLLTGLAGIILSVEPLVRVAARRASRGPLWLRASLRDALAHPARVVPAVAATLITSLLMGGLIVVSASARSNDRDNVLNIAGEGHLAIGTHAPVSDEFDRAVIMDALERIHEKHPIRAHAPIESVSDWVLEAERPTPCGPHEEADTRSALEPDQPQRCLPYQVAYAPSQLSAWWTGGDTLVLSPQAAMITGHPNAGAAAETLAAGGVIVADATKVADDGTVRVNVYQPTDSGHRLVRTVSLPGVFIPGFGARLVISPQAVKTLELPKPVYVAEIVEFETPVGESDQDALRRELDEDAPLAWILMGGDLTHTAKLFLLIQLAALALLALVATGISVTLARTQATADLTTMSAVGASPGFLRRYLAGQAGVILLLGVPFGFAFGIGLGAWYVAWQQRTLVSGAWRVTVFDWPLQVLAFAGITLFGFALAVALARLPKQLAYRRME